MGRHFVDFMTRTNIILASIDSLRADHCGYVGDDRRLTPTLDSLASEGIAFETAISPGPQTFSSMPVAVTGQKQPPVRLDDYPGETYWERRLAAINEHLERHTTLPERLQELGYETAAITPNPWTSAAAGFDRGFDHFVDLSGKRSDGLAHRLADAAPGLATDSRKVELVMNMLAGESFFNQWEELYGALSRLETELSEPYFVWVFLLDTHFPFLTTRAHREEQSWLGMYASMYRSEAALRKNDGALPPSVLNSVKRSYRDTVRSVDNFLAQLRHDFEPDDPALIVHSDHGESFGEHGNYGHHHRQVYEENVHVPYVVHNVDGSEAVTDPVSLSSIHDVGLEIATTGTVTPDAVTDESVVSTSMTGENRAVRERRFKYVDHEDETPALFDLQTDPHERTDISDHRPEYARKCATRLETHYSHLTEVERLYEATEPLAVRSDL